MGLNQLMDLISEIRDAWGWTGIDPLRVVSQNDFGNLIIRDKDGKYWRLCPEDVYCEVIAKDQNELDNLSKDAEFLEDWRMSALVEAARNSVGLLTEGRAYHLVIPGALGGAYDVSNIRSAPIVELIRFSGDLGKQIRDLPDGEQVQLKLID
ncbi:MAG: T6SS immunity protein Tdi1 domain-containing protein [Pseudomonadota bacterium]